MRSVLLAALVIALLTVGLLVIKNMGSNSSGQVAETKAKQAIERAEDAKARVNQNALNLQNQLQGPD